MVEKNRERSKERVDAIYSRHLLVFFANKIKLFHKCVAYFICDAAFHTLCIAILTCHINHFVLHKFRFFKEKKIHDIRHFFGKTTVEIVRACVLYQLFMW